MFFTVGTVLSQTFMHGAGITIFVASPKNGDVSVGESLTYSPRFNFLETENLSVSVGIPLSLGISYTSYTTSYYSDFSLGFVLNAPLIVNINMGRGSTKENTDKFGYFAGAGFGYHHGEFLLYDTYYDITPVSKNDYGPAANAGLRFGVGRNHMNIEVRFSYMKGLNSDKIYSFVNKPNIFGVGCAFNF